ncbi:putative glycoside hydrolase [Thermohalobacter berrensis]|uniref:Glycoside hydrolase n=1 Tax=Thermohalobacter berrensis TaxID=99594 RepID=A0A419T822_9FIRM|nr:putative glycoside hydrolase [Thermohalobacter berrensis]RKD33737.1 glycoside hydrolase [Thermohalobacter berrensis]
MKKLNVFISVLLLVIILVGVYQFQKGDLIEKLSLSKVKASEKELETSNIIDHYLAQPNSDWSIHKEKVTVKGIYITGNTLAYNKRFYKLLDLLNTTELNTMVIDVKDDNGILTYESNVKMANEFGADKQPKVKNFMEKMEILRNNNVYPIARIVTFKDKIAASRRPDLAIKTKDGKVWRDNKGNAWLNPYNKESWEYPIRLAEEAALMGFKEIQFDYVRFPTDGNRSIIDYGEIAKNKSMAEAISEFLAYARKRLEPKGVYVSADIFGLVTTVKDDMGIGQHLETLSTSADILSPMVYPSHYALGSYGVKYPDSNPYKIVHTSLSTAKNRIDKLETQKKKAIIRPWLQDFSAPWLKKLYGKHYVSYGPEQIRAQIKATYDAGLEEWIFWNASNRYTENGYLKEENINN